MPGADLFLGVKSKSGGLIGQSHNVTITDIAVVEHHLEKKGPDGKTVVERYPTACFTKLSIFVEDAEVDPQYRQGDQYLQVGRLPLWRTQQLGEQPDKNQITYPGGFMPSLDAAGEQPATAGPFVRVEGEDGIWEGAEHHIFFGELASLANQAGQLERLKAEVAAKGVAAIKGIRLHLGTKAKPKSRKAQAAAAPKPGQAAVAEQERTVLVPDKVNQWPWEAAQGGQGVGVVNQPTTATPPIAAPVATPMVAPAAPAMPVVAAPPAQPTLTIPAAVPAVGAANYDQLAVDVLRKAVKASGGMVAMGDVLTKVFAATADMGNGTDRSQVMQRVNDPAWVAAQVAAGQFMFDGKTIMYAGN